jgi:hypothetical protein
VGNSSIHDSVRAAIDSGQDLRNLLVSTGCVERSELEKKDGADQALRNARSALSASQYDKAIWFAMRSIIRALWEWQRSLGKRVHHTTHKGSIECPVFQRLENCFDYRLEKPWTRRLLFLVTLNARYLVGR